MDEILEFILNSPFAEFLPAFQGSFNLAFPPNADFPDDIFDPDAN